MSRREQTDQSGDRRRSAALIAVSAAGVLLAVVAVVVVLVADGAEPSDPVEADGWSATAVLCTATDGFDVLGEPERGDVLQLDEAEDVLSVAGCVGADADADAVSVDPDRSAFLVGTGVDRDDVRLVEVDASEEPVALRAELEIPGDECVVTAEFRGVLALLVEGPSGATIPTVELVEFPVDC